MYLRRIRLANWLKSCRSFCRIWFSFVTGVGINFWERRESNLVWSGFNWKSVRFLMCLLLDFVFSLFLFHLLNLLRLLRFWFSSLHFLTNFPPSMSCVDTEKRQGYDSLTLFWTFFISDNFCIIAYLGDLFLDIVYQLAYIFLYIDFASGGKCFVLGLVENSLRSILSMSSSVFLTK